jgi:hypothetical protein
LLYTRAGLYSFKKLKLEIVTKFYPFVIPIVDFFDLLLCSTNYKIVNGGIWWVGAKKAGPFISNEYCILLYSTYIK